jgi:hypothetical protein
MEIFKTLIKYPGIAVSYDNGSATFFEIMVLDALSNLSRFKTGKALLLGISNANPASPYNDSGNDVNVVIKPTDNKLQVIRKGYQYPTNTSDKSVNGQNEYRNYLLDGYFNEDKSRSVQQIKAILLHSPKNRAAAENGTGSAANVKFSNSVRKLNSGLDSPPFVGLGHELIHALHSLQGENKGGSEEEKRTVGIGQYASEVISENALRKDANLPLRMQY